MNVSRPLSLLACSFALLTCSALAACGGSPNAGPTTTAPDPGPQPGTAAGPSAPDGPVDAPPPQAERPAMSAEDCTAKGGKVVGDIGDGAIHRPDYRCPSGSAPMGRIALGVEGSVCCT